MLAVALACGGDAPAPLPTETTTPASTPPTVATPPSTPVPTPVATPTPTPTPEPTPTPFPTPTGPAVTVTGPLVVFSDRIGEVTWDGDNQRRVETRRVYVYDLGADTYWAAFDHRDAVIEMAAASLIVWTEGQLRRVGLNGYTEAILFEREGIETVELKASPDGTKVALLYDGRLLVLDVATGEELLRVPYPAIPEGWHALHLGNWHADGHSLAVTGRRWGQTALVSLDGTVRVLPEGWLPSPGLRYAVRFTGSSDYWGLVREGFEVVDVQSEAVLATVVPQNHPWLVPYGAVTQQSWPNDWYGTGWRSSPDQYMYFELTSGEGKYSTQGARILQDWEYGTSIWNAGYYGVLEPRILDISTGDHRALPRAEWHSIQRELLRSECERWWQWWRISTEIPRCILLYGDEFAWHGVNIRALGIVETDPFVMRGITPSKRWRQPDAPALPAREDLIGPILVWSAQGDTGYALDDHGSLRLYEQRHIILYDEGTGNSWQYTPGKQFYHPSQEYPGVAAVKDGLIMWEWDGTLDYVSLFNQTPQTIVEDTREWFHVTTSPNGSMVVVEWFGFWAPDRPIVVYGIPSGEKILSFRKSEIPVDSSKVDCHGGSNFISVDRWGIQGNDLVLTTMGEGGCDALLGTLSIDGSYTDRTTLGCLSCLSPDLRHYFTGESIIETSSGTPIWSLDVDDHTIAYNYYRTWISPEYFAWSDEWFDFQSQRIPFGAESAEVSVLHVPTGEVEVMDSAEYLARFRPEPRARAECPDDRTQPCRILLDGEVVGEGLWASIIGFIELDEDSALGQ